MNDTTPKMVSFRLDADLLQQLDAWIAKQELPPSKTAVFELALREFLARRTKK